MRPMATRTFCPFAVVAALSITACGTDEVPDPIADAAVMVAPDALPIDVGPIDSGVLGDVGSAFNASSCLPCSPDCPGDGLCVTAGTERFCVDRCDDDLYGCLSGFSCVNIAAAGQPSTFVCVPPSGMCDQTIGFGTPCKDHIGSCHPDRLRCQGDPRGVGYCTDPCQTNGGCPEGWACGEGDDGNLACIAAFVSGAERCTHEGRADEPGCTLDVDCAAGRCVGAKPGLAGVCAVPCGSANTCAVGSTCRRDGTGNLACIPDRCECRADHLPIDAADGTRNLLDEALEAVGLDRCATRYDTRDWTAISGSIAHDPYRLSFYDPIHNEPLRAPRWGADLVADLDAAAMSADGPAHRAALLVERLAQLLDHPAVRRPANAPDPVEPLVQAVADFITATGGAANLATLRADAMDVPVDLQLAMATVIDGARRAVVARRAAFAGASANQVDQLYRFGPAFIAARADGLGIAPAGRGIETLLNETILYGELYGGAADVLDAIDMADLSRFAVAAGTSTEATTAAFLFNQMTPAGRIAIGSGANSIYDENATDQDGAWAVLVDLGGHDTYRIPVGGNATAENVVAVGIDLGGSDQYRYVEVPHPMDGGRLVSDSGGRLMPGMNDPRGPISFSDVPRQGGGRAGTGVLVDLGGDDDHYQSLRMSQGSGIFGTGVLIDDGGDDRYLAEAVAQGAGTFGIGVQLDLGGNDYRRGYQAVQGFAFARGAGLSYDVAGDDEYSSDVGDSNFGGDPLYPSAQREGLSNASFSQGFGFGRRADFSDGANMSAGVGILVDAAGNDEYEGSIFTQGGGFWFGTGILADHSGNDVYDGMWYAMGNGAHYALGLLLEGAGDDRYGGRLPRINVTAGAGHDYTVAFLIDDGGNDTYQTGRITLGAGNVNGMGFLIDNGGDDSYSATQPYSVGAAGLLEAGTMEPGASRRKVDTVGVFIDAAGTDTYEIMGMVPPGVGNDSMWGRPQTAESDAMKRRKERATAIDGVGETTLRARPR